MYLLKKPSVVNGKETPHQIGMIQNIMIITIVVLFVLVGGYFIIRYLRNRGTQQYQLAPIVEVLELSETQYDGEYAL